MVTYKRFDWACWAVISLLLIAGLAWRFEAFYGVAAVSAVHAVYSRIRTGRFAAFPTQVRWVYLGIVLVALLPPFHLMFWPLTFATPFRVLFNYCLLARFLALLPWNLRQPLSWRVAWRMFTVPPV
ncbi:MAG TPA: hypothetical protein VF678_04030, partial [bacterium]